MRKSLVVILITVVASLLLLNAVALAVDSDGDMVPDEFDKYPGRNDLKYGGTLVIGTYDVPETMDTLRTSVGVWMHMLISEPPLVESPLGGNIVKMGWIDWYDISDDELKLTLRIKEGVTFHDGVPLNAEAFATILRNRKTHADMYSIPLANVPLENIRVLDEYTVQIEQTKWTPGFYEEIRNESWFGGMGTPNAIERYGPEYGSTMAYGNGPFKLVEWVRGDHLTFVRNEDYNWAPGFAANPGPPYLEKIIVKIIPEEITRIEMLKAGEIDVIRDVPPSKVEEVSQLDGFNFWERSRYKLFYIEYNTNVAPLNELAVRQALNYALDKRAVADTIFYGRAEPAYSFYQSSEFLGLGAKQMYQYDPEKAKELLENAGWIDTNGDGIREKNGEKLEFELWSRLETYYKAIAIVAQGYWMDIGVNAIVTHLDYNALRDKVNKEEHAAVVWHHAWPYLGGWADWWFDPDSYPYPHISGLDTPEIYELHNAVVGSKSNAEFGETTEDLLNYVLEMAVGAPIAYPMAFMAFSADLKNILPRTYANRIMPFLYDVYSQKVYEENLAKWTNE